jgi:hypothetical protein
LDHLTHEVALAVLTNTHHTNRFLIDSGASSQYCHDRSAFITFKEIPSTARQGFTVANDVLLRVFNGSQYICVRIPNVYYVPLLQNCLLSVSQLNDRGLDVLFFAHSPAEIRNGFVAIGKGKCDGRLIVLDTLPLTASDRINAATTNAAPTKQPLRDTYNRWRSR